MQILESMCGLSVAIDCTTVHRFICAMDHARAWPIAGELFASACAAVGMTQLCRAQHADAAKLPAEQRALYGRVRVCCESGFVLRGWANGRDDGAHLAACCNAMLAAYAHAAPVQLVRAGHLLAAMTECGPTTMCTLFLLPMCKCTCCALACCCCIH